MKVLQFPGSRRPARRSVLSGIPGLQRGGYHSGDDDNRRQVLLGILLLALMAAVIGAAIYYGAREEDATRRSRETLCLVQRPAPEAALALLDVTDPLAAGSGARFTNLITQVRNALPRDGRLTVVPFGGNLGESLSPVFDGCSPGRGAEARTLIEGAGRVERDYQKGFATKLATAAQGLRTAQSSPDSPIVEQVQRAVSDPSIVWQGDSKRLILLTDGLYNVEGARIYRTGKIVLPQPPAGLLEGVTVDYIELANPAHPKLQTAELRAAWQAWFEAAGAKRVNMYAAGYARLAPGS